MTLCHPGPIATGTEGQPRCLYGPKGPITHSDPPASTKGRQSTKRVAALVLQAAYNNVESCWICQHPILVTGQISQIAGLVDFADVLDSMMSMLDSLWVILKSLFSLTSVTLRSRKTAKMGEACRMGIKLSFSIAEVLCVGTKRLCVISGKPVT